MLCVVIHKFELPEGYAPREVDLLLRLPAGYPDAAPDMFWVIPSVTLARTGQVPQAATSMEPYLKRTWQRFSRHLSPGVWQAGRDDLRSYLALITRDLEKGAS